MATTNYSLPTLENTALFDLVTDYNALANATDAALAKVAGLVPTEAITEMQGQISSLQTLTGSQGSQITALQSQMSTANGNITTLQSGLETANSNIGTLQSGQQEINGKIGNINTSFNNYSTFSTKYYQGVNIHSAATTSSLIYVTKNVGETIIKICGNVDISSSQARVKVPGTTFVDGNTAYAVKTNIKVVNKTIASGYLVLCSALSSSSSSANTYNTSPAYAIGSDGYLYLSISSNNTAVDFNQTLLLATPIYIGSPIAAAR